MRTGAAVDHVGYFHESLCYSSDDELLTVGVPFLLGGVEAGEPTMVALDPPHAALIRAAMPAAAATAITFIDNREVYANPAGSIASYRKLLAGHVGSGAGQIRILGDLSPVSSGPTWHWWARYEAAINHAYDDFPLWSMCAYDTRIVPGHVLDDVAATHPRSATAEGHPANAGFVDPAEFLSRPWPIVDDPVRAAAPVVELTDPSPAAARRAIAAAGRGALSAKETADLELAVSEAVTNAICHGRAPVRMRVWTAADRVLVTVNDHGNGPTHPYAGLVPQDRENGGYGLWLAHRLCSNVVLDHRDGFTIHLTAGNPNF